MERFESFFFFSFFEFFDRYVLSERCDRAEEVANERVESLLKQKDEELLDTRAKCDDATARCTKANAVLEERGIVRQIGNHQKLYNLLIRQRVEPNHIEAV